MDVVTSSLALSEVRRENTRCWVPSLPRPVLNREGEEEHFQCRCKGFCSCPGKCPFRGASEPVGPGFFCKEFGREAKGRSARGIAKHRLFPVCTSTDWRYLFWFCHFGSWGFSFVRCAETGEPFYFFQLFFLNLNCSFKRFYQNGALGPLSCALWVRCWVFRIFSSREHTWGIYYILNVKESRNLPHWVRSLIAQGMLSNHLLSVSFVIVILKIA